MRCCNAGHANQLGHCVQLKHGHTTWQVRKPNTIRLGGTRPCWLMDHCWTPASPLLPWLSHQRTQWRSGGAEAAGVHVSVRTEGRVPLGLASTRRVAAERLKAPPDHLLLVHLQCLTLRQLQSQLLQLQPPLWQLQSQLLQLQSPRLCNLSPLLLTKVSFASLFVFRLAFAGSCKIGQRGGRYCNQFLMHVNVMQETVYILLCVAGCVACFCLPCQSHCVYLLIVFHHVVVFGEPRQPLWMLQTQLA